MVLIRILVFGALIYFGYRYVRSRLGLGGGRSRNQVGKKQNNTPPPYDPSRVEDIDYKEVDKKGPRS